MNTNIITKKTKLSSFAMFVLALSPILFYYNIGDSKITILMLLGFLLLIGLFFGGHFSFKKLPNTYLLYWGWCTIQLYIIAGISGWSDYLPGGILLCVFSILLVVMVQLLNYDKLYHYMRWVFIVSSALLFFQYVIYLSDRTILFLVPPLTDNIGGETIEELMARNARSITGGGVRFSSIFMEPSYFGQYGLILLTMELFSEKNKNKLFTKFSLFIVITLLALRSGAGLLGLAIIGIVKVLYIIITTKNTRYYVLLAVLIPVVFLILKYYLASSSGAYVAPRMNELDASNEEGSGFSRIFFGWNYFLELDIKSMILGTSRNHAFGFEKGFTNMVTYVVTSQGVIGLGLLIWFYVKESLKKPFIAWALVITMTTIALIEACYLGGLMLIVSSTIIGLKYSKIKT